MQKKFSFGTKEKKKRHNCNLRNNREIKSVIRVKETCKRRIVPNIEINGTMHGLLVLPSSHSTYWPHEEYERCYM